MKELKAGDKVVQQMTRDGAVEVNKATGGTERISNRDNDNARPSETSPGVEAIGGIEKRVQTERKAAKKRAQRKTNKKIFESYQKKPETTRLQFTDAERANPAMSKAIKQSDRAATRYEKARAKMPKETALVFESVPGENNEPSTASRNPADPKKKPQGKQQAKQQAKSQAKPQGKTQANPQTKPQKKQQANPKSPKYNNPNTGGVKGKQDGKPETRLVFRERDKPPNGKLIHALDRPGREAANIARNEVSKHEKVNTGIQAAGATERAARSALHTTRNIHSRLKFEPQKKLLRAEKQATKANVNAIYKRNLRTNPELQRAGALKKAAYKRRLKRQYAKAFRQGNIRGVKGAVTATKGAAVKAGAALKIKLLLMKLKIAAIKTAKAIALSWKILAIAGIFFFLMILLVSCLSSCMSMFGGGFSSVIATSFTAEDEDIHGAHGDYLALENALSQRIANIHNEFPGFDEYRFNLDPIGHDPFALISYLTARYFMFTQDEVQASLAALFARQYVLTLTPITEIRTRTETREGTGTGTDPDGNPYTYTYTYTVTVEYEWHILVVTLVNRGLEAAALDNLTPDEAEMYHVLMETQGNRPELFP